MPRAWRLVFSCEHGGNRIPAQYRTCFQHCTDQLRDHRGYDIGALSLARSLARQLHAPLEYSTVSRLLVDLNRSLHHRALFGSPIRQLDRDCRQTIINRYYLPYRDRVEGKIANLIRRDNNVLHLSIHSFTGTWHGQLRRADIGLLYDPARLHERCLSRALITLLRENNTDLRIRRNYPYRGTADGLTTALRRKFASSRYAGIELEINQELVVQKGARWRAVQALIGHTIASVISGS